MRRDFDLMREVLLRADAATTYVDIPGTQDEAGQKLFYNVTLLIENGYLEGVNTGTTREDRWRLVGMTWKGHEFLDAVRSDEMWAYLKTKLPIDQAEIPFHLVEQYAFHVAAQKATAMSP